MANHKRVKVLTDRDGFTQGYIYKAYPGHDPNADWVVIMDNPDNLQGWFLTENLGHTSLTLDDFEESDRGKKGWYVSPVFLEIVYVNMLKNIYEE